MHERLVESRQRAECYKLLSACYCKPTEEFVEERVADELMNVFSSVCPDGVTYARQMSEAILNSDIVDVLVDYSRLFVGPFKLLAPPYGSVYLDKGGLLMGDSTIDAVKLYIEAGVEMDRDTQSDMPDHIAVELEFIYYLLFKEIESIEKGDSESAKRYESLRKDFLKRHLCAWAFKFLESMKKEAQHPFYKNLALCTETFLRQEMLRDLAVEV